MNFLADFLAVAGAPFRFLALLGIYRLFWWDDSGQRFWWKFASWKTAIPHWNTLNTPRRVIYHRLDQINDDEKVKCLYQSAATALDDLQRRIAGKVFAKDDASDQIVAEKMSEWKSLVDEAHYRLIYRREPCLAGGWAQTRDPRTSSCLLAMEWVFCHLGPWTHSVVGHELTHVAQEVENCTLRREWKKRKRFRDCLMLGLRCAMTGKWKELARQTKYAMVLVKVLRREIGIEGEAYAAFPLFPVSFLLVVIPAIVALAIFPKLW